MNTIPETIGWQRCEIGLPPRFIKVLTFDGYYIDTGHHIGGKWFSANDGHVMDPQPTHWATVQGPKQPA